MYIDICHIFFQMICQKLCQKSVAGWGSLEAAGNSWCLLKSWWLELPLGKTGMAICMKLPRPLFTPPLWLHLPFCWPCLKAGFAKN
jgi:hypothetical protein